MGELEPWIDENFVRSVWYGLGEQVNVKMIRDKFSGSVGQPISHHAQIANGYRLEAMLAIALSTLLARLLQPKLFSLTELLSQTPTVLSNSTGHQAVDSRTEGWLHDEISS